MTLNLMMSRVNLHNNTEVQTLIIQDINLFGMRPSEHGTLRQLIVVYECRVVDVTKMMNLSTN